MSYIGEQMDAGQAQSFAAFTRSPLYLSLLAKGATPSELKIIYYHAFKTGAAVAVSSLLISVLTGSNEQVRPNVSDQIENILGSATEQKAITDKNGKAVI